MMTTYSVHSVHLPSHFIDITHELLMKECKIYGDIHGFLDHDAAHYLRTVNEKELVFKSFRLTIHIVCA
jgi:hypothetical protein